MKTVFNTKNYIFIFICFASLIILTGCSSTSVRNIEQQLKNKYGQDFFLVHNGNDAYTSSDVYIFEDQKGREFEVKVNTNFILDDYFSVLYDSQITKKINKLFSNEIKYKIFANSSGFYTSENEYYNSMASYFDNCSSINIVIYTNSSINLSEISNILKQEKMNPKLEVWVYQISNSNFEKAKEDSEYNSNIEILDYKYFFIEDGKLTIS